MEQNDKQAIEVLREVALEGVKEQRRSRRWSIFFKLLMAAYVLLISVFYYSVIKGDKMLLLKNQCLERLTYE